MGEAVNTPKKGSGGPNLVAHKEPYFTEQVAEQSGEASQLTIGETSISAMEAAAIRAEFRAVMQKELSEGRAALRGTLGLPEEKSVKSGIALQSKSVIHLATTTSQKTELPLDPLSRWLVLIPIQGMV